ncbi:MAG: response regulator [Candidatus Edwardsbacteria bacterium]|nr:response regulator [Candidatus Edwardsbacteria bacterium]MBU1577115.1 response regulator [Candidatus Edwardsbacteria bacterium]MBU2593789.1 response regulator [Candidatus Edwardsbacteria bacterium]
MSKYRILVVEDEAIVARDICKRLDDMGYQVAAKADNGEAALAQARELKPDLVLMDIVIKGKQNGIDVANIIKSELGIPLIYLTAYADDDTVERAKTAEPFGYIIKPFNDRDLNVTIQMALYRNKMEKKLADREERYRDLFENTSDIIMLLDEQGCFKYVNQRWHSALGYGPDEIGSLNIFDILDQSCLDHCRYNFGQVLSGKEATVEAIFRTKDGKTIIVEGNCNSSHSPGKPTWVRGIFRDITEKKRSRQLQEAMYQIANETALSGNLDELYRSLHNILGRLLDTKNFYISLYDSENDLLSFPYFMDEYDLVPQNRPMGTGITEYLIRSKKPLLATPEVYQKLIDSGQIRLIGKPSVDWLGVPLLVSDRYTGTLVIQSYDQGIRFGERERDILTFISEQVAFAIHRKLAEEALKLSEEKYRSLVEQINDVIFLTDSSGIIQYISPAIERMTQFTVDEITGQPFFKFIHPDDLPGLKQSFQRNLKGVEEPWEYRLIDKNGTTVFVRSSSRLLADDNGNPTGIMGTLTDITQAKQMASQLQQAQKMEAIGQLAGGIAHDFNNLLAGIIGHAEMLQIKLINQPSLAALAEKILTTGEHAANLTKQLLSFARKGNYQQVPVSIHRIIAEVAGILGNTVNKNINVRQSLSANPCTVLGDPAMLENALLNLCLNARDAMAKGGNLTVTTQVAELDESYVKNHSYKIPVGSYIKISVSDTGQGMSKDVQSHIYEPFFTTKEQGKGTGLGLASVYGCVKAHNGSIEVYSEEGHGSTFNIYLPLAEPGPEKTEEAAKAPAQKGTGRILLVDDEETIRDITSQMLDDRGYKVTTLSNGQEAVEYYREHFQEIDLVILDMIMPKMNGHEAFIKMKEINPGVKVLLSSGYSIEEEAQDLMNSGVKGFLQKPYRLAELTQKINQAMAN